MNYRTSERLLEERRDNSSADAAWRPHQAELPAAATAWSPPWQARWVEVLKYRLLLRLLDQSLPELHALLIREADEAASLAGRTRFPLLVFPCLFEERVAAALERHRLQLRNYWRTLEVVTAT
jgi:hypothetical protein